MTLVASTESAVPLAERRLVAPEDTIGKVKLVAPEDSSSPEFMESSPVVAPMDSVPTRFSHFLGDIHRQNRKPDLLGLTARFYGHRPSDDCKGAAPMGSAIDRVLDYEGSRGNFMEFIKSQNVEPGRVFYGKWTGTLNILMAGEYTLDLDIGFDTMSSLKIDGVETKSVGQCRIAADEFTCIKKGCAWKTGSCVPEEAKEAALVAVEQAQLPSAAAVAAASPAPAPMNVIAASPFAAEESLMPPSNDEESLIPSPEEQSEDAKADAAKAEFEAKVAKGIKGKNAAFELSAGGHCIEIVVMAAAAHGSVQLRYKGPDTDSIDTVMPGQVLFCDPVVAACQEPELDTCAFLKPDCSKCFLMRVRSSIVAHGGSRYLSCTPPHS